MYANLGYGQSLDRPLGSIWLVKCIDRDERIVAPPDAEYPRYVGNGPHKFDGEVAVQVTIDDQGKVIAAKGISGHPFFRRQLETYLSAIRFRPLLNNEKLESKKVVMVYSVKPPRPKGKGKSLSGIVSCGFCGQQAIYLPKPDYPEAARFALSEGTVEVAIIIGTDGSVIEATIISGHPFFHENSLKAALKARFTPLLLSGRPVKVASSIKFNFRR